MRRLYVFIAHEARTQFRSLRFLILGAAFVATSLLPPGTFFFLARRSKDFIADGMFASSVFLLEPLLAALFVAVLSVDGISRERDENSFRVVSLAPISNTAYLTYRWAAIATMVISLTTLPPLGGWLMAWATHGNAPDPGLFFWPWLLHVVPLTLSTGALAIALGTIMGSLVPAALAWLLIFGIGFGFLNDILWRFGRVVSGPGQWLGLDFQRTGRLLNFGRPFYSVASDAPYDPARAVDEFLIYGALFVGIASALFGIGLAYLRRTRPNVRPWHIRADHPLRTYGKLFNRLREDFTPDPKLSLFDRLATLSGFVIFSGALGGTLLVEDRYRTMARDRYEVEISNAPEPTPRAVTPLLWKVRGRIAPNGSSTIETLTEATLRNDGAEPVGHIAFSLNPMITVDALQSSRGTASFQKRWDRLSVDLVPPLEPAEKRTITVALAGTPANVNFPLPSNASFVEQYRYYVKRRMMAVDFARTHRENAIDRGRIALPADAIMPVPRFGDWKLVTEADRVEDATLYVPMESYFPPTEIDIELETPAERFVADSCGTFVPARSGTQTFRSRCSHPVADYLVFAAKLNPTTDPVSGITLASLPQHQELAGERITAMAEAASMARKAWPGFDPLRGAVVVEVPPPFQVNRFDAGDNRNWFGSAQPSGKLVPLPEAELISRWRAEPEGIAAHALASELMQRRPVISEHTDFFRFFYRAVTLSRLGKGRTTRAAVGPQTAIDSPILEGDRWYSAVWHQRLPAVLADIEHRVGSAHFSKAIESFVNQRSSSRAKARDLIDAIAVESGVSLDRMWADYFVGNALPQMTLENVEFRKRSEEWIVSGSLRNKGTGQVFCPIVLRTDFDPVQITVTVDSKESQPFELRSRYDPRTLQLDPQNVCYRFAAIGLIDRVEYEGHP